MLETIIKPGIYEHYTPMAIYKSTLLCITYPSINLGMLGAQATTYGAFNANSPNNPSFPPLHSSSTQTHPSIVQNIFQQDLYHTILPILDHSQIINLIISTS